MSVRLQATPAIYLTGQKQYPQNEELVLQHCLTTENKI
jgi:hypothetical protein